MKKTADIRSVYSGIKKDSPERKKNDFYPTPPLATYILNKYIELPKTILEPCAGRGNISVELERLGHTVKSYDLNQYENPLVDIITGQDVLLLKKQEDCQALVTNPPYFKDLPLKIAKKSISEYDLTALFTRITFFEGKKRRKLFLDTKPSDILFFSDRVRFTEKDIPEPVEKEDQIGGMIAYMWIVFNKKAEHENTRLRWILLEEEYEEWRRSRGLDTE